MPGKNRVTLTFAGDKKLLDRTVDGVGSSLDRMEKRVDQSSSRMSPLGGKSASGFAFSFSERIGPLLAKAPISPPLIGGFAVAGAAGAPILGAAVSAGILMGLGGGVLALGIKSAMKDPAVAGAWKGFGDRANKAFANFGTPFKAPLIRAADTFGDTLERIAPAADRMGKTMAPVIDKLAPALAQMAEKAMPGIEKAVTASVPLFEKLAEHAPAIGEAISRFFDSIAAAAPGATILLDKTLSLFEGLIIVVGETFEFLSKALEKGSQLGSAAIGKLGAAWDWLKGKVTTVRNWITDNWNRSMTFLQGLPGRARSAFSGMFDGVKSAFRSALNWVIARWNNFSIPGIGTPFGTIGGFNTPDIPMFHQGGTMPGAPGTEGLALLQAGEKVTPPGRGDRTVIEIRSAGSRMDDLLVELLARAVAARGGNVQVAVTGHA